MQGKATSPQLKQLRELDLNTIDKPKTLVILHYNRKRISVPLFKEVFDMADLLYHHISTLEKQILSHDPDWEKKAKQQIVCFQIKKEEGVKNNSDGDFRSDVMLSLLRVRGQQVVSQLVFRADVTKIYKYIEVQPFFRTFQMAESRYNMDSPLYYSLQRILSSTVNSNIYLGRRISDGHFFAVRVFASGSKVGISEARVVDHMAYIDQQSPEAKNSLLVRSQIIAFIPHPQAESSQQQQTAESCRHISLIYPHFVRGTLEQLLQDSRFGRKRISQMDCLNYLKQLMWGVHLLHQKYHLVHRALTPSNIQIDQNGQLKLAQFAFSVPCFDAQGQYAHYCPKTKYPKAGYSLEELLEEEGLELGQFAAPELMRGQQYDYLVDFYSVGMIIRRLYEQSQMLQRAPVNQNNQNLMMAMIQKLTSNDLAERANISHEILEDIARQDQEEQPLTQMQPLTLQQIRVGKNIENSSNKKYIQSEEISNGIDNEVIINFFKKPPQPIGLRPKKQRKGSKQKLLTKSKEKSEKSHSKVSDISQSKKRKISSGKNKSFNNTSDLGKDSRQKHSSQKLTNESPAHRKTGKSKSHQKKKDPLTCTKLYTYHEQQKRPIVVPKSPKVPTLPHRAKSPAIRER